MNDRMSCLSPRLPFGAVFLAAMFALAVASPATAAQAQNDPNCRGDRSSGACLEALSRGKSELYGVRTLEAHRTAGDQVRRIFYDDGYGDDLILIAFVRAPGANSVLSVHFPRLRDGRLREPLTVALSREAWRAALLRQADFTSTPPARDPSILCMHGWTYLIEAADPVRGREAEQRRAIENSCDFGPAARHAAEIERAALPFFPYCARLDPRQHRNPASQLAACALLRGDRMAAAEVMNLAAPFRAITGPWDAAQLASVLTARSRINWNGERNEIGGSAAAFWATRAAPRISATTIRFEAIEGGGAGRVRAWGRLSRFVDGPQGLTTIETARVEQIWVRQPAGAFQVESATVGPWVPYTPR